jgi:hypothetical protein
MSDIRKWAIAGGRSALGTVKLDDDGKFVAIDIAGRSIGKFTSLLAASRAFDTPHER